MSSAESSDVGRPSGVTLRFDPNQGHQREAIRSVVALFGDDASASMDTPEVLERLQMVQRGNGLAVSERLDGPHFSVEMETGTGKTYTYLRTMHELSERHGVRQFVIVVPSVAIREGVLEQIRATARHFHDIYGQNIEARVYNSGRLSELRTFSDPRGIVALVMNIDAFNKRGRKGKAANIIHRPQDMLGGRRPIALIQKARPVVIVDEPQNMESPLARAALASHFRLVFKSVQQREQGNAPW